MMIRTLKFFVALAVLLGLFVLIFPWFRNLENMNGQMAARGSGGKFIQLDNNINVHYVEKGTGKRNIILIHGFSSSVYTWKDVIGPLSRDYHVYALDLPGFGFSDKPRDNFTYDYENFAHTVRKFMDEKGIGKATVAGSSMGGGVAVKFAVLYPQRTDRVILVDSAGYARTEGHGPLDLLAKPLLGRFLFSLNSPAAMKVILQRTSFHDDNLVTDERAQAYFKPFRVDGAAQAARTTFKNISGASLAQDIKKINKPTLILWGANDELIPPIYAKSFNSDIKGSKLVMVPGCGHLPEEENPEAFVKAVLEFAP